MLGACTDPYAVPKKGEHEENSRVIFEDIEKEKRSYQQYPLVFIIILIKLKYHLS